jgi:hypothetical protein
MGTETFRRLSLACADDYGVTGMRGPTILSTIGSHCDYQLAYLAALSISFNSASDKRISAALRFSSR